MQLSGSSNVSRANPKALFMSGGSANAKSVKTLNQHGI